MKTLRLILGDQLNHSHTWYNHVDTDTHYLLMEIRQETDYADHHIQKVLGFFAAMRNFASHLEALGHSVIYLKINDENNTQSLPKNINWILKEQSFEKFEYQLPDEYRLDQQLYGFCGGLNSTWEVYDTEHFITDRDFLAHFFKGKKTFLMENFYREIRKRENILLEKDNKPTGGEWNYDKENRKKYPNKHELPDRTSRKTDLTAIQLEIEEAGIKTIGSVEAKAFRWPTTRAEALDDLESFCTVFLPNFGNYQDAMSEGIDFGYHSLLSFAMNIKLLSPREVISRVVAEWEKNDKVSIASTEGYVRQLAGWREFMRGVYWAKMPEYATLNKLNHTRKLPSWYWTGETKMKCMSHAVNQSLKYSYAHHIQRLMITGNFALLAMIDPKEVDDWYLGIYIDAIEWVEITNTRGMSQFADGGIVGTKPYVSSANYIHKMSDYCKSCHYDYKQKTGKGACPFNSLYWNFYDHHRETLENNPRIGMMYRLLDKMDGKDRTELIEQAGVYLDDIEKL